MKSARSSVNSPLQRCCNQRPVSLVECRARAMRHGSQPGPLHQNILMFSILSHHYIAKHVLLPIFHAPSVPNIIQYMEMITRQHVMTPIKQQIQNNTQEPRPRPRDIIVRSAPPQLKYPPLPPPTSGISLHCHCHHSPASSAVSHTF